MNGYGFGTFKGVFTPSILTIIGVVMYLRFGWMLGNVGLTASLAILSISTAITFLTSLSISALATNMKIKGGGAYYIVSRSFGIETGAAVGIPLFFSQAIAIAFYVTGFTEAFCDSIPFAAAWDRHIVAMAAMTVLFAIAYFSANVALKTQYVIMAAIGASLVSLMLGSAPELSSLKNAIPQDALASDAASRAFLDANSPGFWPVFAVFFPAVTGILSGLGMSGDLENPRRSIPVGTISAVVCGYIVYGAVLLALDRFAGPSPQMRGALVGDQMFLAKAARWSPLIVAGIWAACLSSAIGSLLAAPRVLQAVSRDGALPRFLGRGFGSGDDPRIASVFSFGIAATAIFTGDINAIAGLLTMFNLAVYCMLNLSAGFEELLGNPSWRPTFRVKSSLSFLGAAGCLASMLMIDAGSTFVAVACIMAIFFVMKRKAMTARWGDMRLGLLMGAVRAAMNKIDEFSKREEHNWRPILLVMSGAPLKRPGLIDMAQAISRNRSLVTVASIVPPEAWSRDRAVLMRDAIASHLAERRIEAQVKITPADDRYEGMRRLIEDYGWGPIVPNTVLLGKPGEAGPTPSFAALARRLSELGRNTVIVGGGGDAGDRPQDPAAAQPRTVDIWWRGKNGNAPFMLALAWLVMRDDAWRGSRLRICHLAESPEAIDEAKKMLRDFTSDSRIEAETLVMPRNSAEKPLETISRVSSTSALTFMGLRQHLEGEDDAAYAAYLQSVFSSTEGIPTPVFSIAAEDIDFKAIFSL